MAVTRLKSKINCMVCRCAQLLWCMLLLSIFSSSFAAHGQERLWWFEIEVLLFKRDINPNDISEAFDSTLQPVGTDNAIDLVTPFLTPDLTWTRDSLPYCLKPPLPPLELTGVSYLPNSLLVDESLTIEQIGVLDLLAGLDDSLISSDDALLDDNVDLENTSPSQSVETGVVQDSSATEQSYSDLIEEAQQPASDYVPRFEHLALVLVEPEDEYQSSMEFDNSVDSDTAFQSVLDELKAPLEEISFTPVNVVMPDSLACVFESEQLQFDIQTEEPEYPEIVLTQIPQQMSGVEWLYSDDSYLLSKESLKLNRLARQIARQRGTNPLLHLGWRQEVLFGRDKAPYYRLFGGKNYATEFAENGEKLIAVEPELAEQGMLDDALAIESDAEPEQQNLVVKIQQALSDPNYQVNDEATDMIEENSQLRVPELWEIDGLFKVFLRYIQGVPYLHIESELDYRAPVFNIRDQNTQSGDVLTSEQQVSLQKFRFSQLRRVISTQVHYFDHPLFGMVVQIRRFDKPQPPEELDEDTSEEDNSINENLHPNRR